MKLNISETIKKLRKEKDITQKTLASALGVTCQSVSRWETGVAYPDIEMIPEIAAYFDISTDILFGRDEANERLKLQQANDILKSDVPTEEKIEKMRAIMDSVPYSALIKYWMIQLYKEMGYAAVGDNIDELRSFANFIIEKDPDWKTIIASIMIQLEKTEEDCQTWISILGNKYGNDVEQALLRRYNYHHEIDMYNMKSQEMVVKQFDELFSYHLDKREANTYNCDSIRQNRLLNLRMVDLLRDPSTDIDAWICKRAWLKMALSVSLFGLDMIEEGYRELDESIGLYEKLLKLDEGTVLKYNSPVLDLIQKKKEDLETIAYWEMVYSLNRMITETGWGWEGFDKVRDDERFISQRERLKSLIPEEYLKN